MLMCIQALTSITSGTLPEVSALKLSLPGNRRQRVISTHIAQIKVFLLVFREATCLISMFELANCPLGELQRSFLQLFFFFLTGSSRGPSSTEPVNCYTCYFMVLLRGCFISYPLCSMAGSVSHFCHSFLSPIHSFSAGYQPPHLVDN